VKSLVVLFLLCAALPAAADPSPATPTTVISTAAQQPRWRRYSLGIQFGIANTPGGHSGIPLAPYRSYGPHLPFALTFRWEANRWSALSVGLGVPQVGLGFAVWSGYELFHRFVADRRGIAAFELYATPGLQLGFAGPDWAARHGNDWVGFEYVYQGPVAFAMRLAAGTRLVLANRLDIFLEAVPIVTFTPSVEPLFTLVAGARIRF
jgi:hypothetical protein